MAKFKRIDDAYKNAGRIKLEKSSKIVLISDCHRGTGSGADNFAKNQNLYYTALRYYDRLGYTYIELGDGDDLWETRHMDGILMEYEHIFGIMADMYREGRFYMLYGNHDMIKKNKKWVKKNLSVYFPAYSTEKATLLPNALVQESIVLSHQKYEIVLLHGHQADFFNDRLWKVGRFLVRYVWRPLELIGILNPMSAATNPNRKLKVEKRLSRWGAENEKLLIAGHTHRANFPAIGQDTYFNDGSCVHPRHITAIEIVNEEISLVNWGVQIKEDGTMYIAREQMYGPVPLEGYFYKSDISVH